MIVFIEFHEIIRFFISRMGDLKIAFDKFAKTKVQSGLTSKEATDWFKAANVSQTHLLLALVAVMILIRLFKEYKILIN